MSPVYRPRKIGVRPSNRVSQLPNMITACLAEHPGAQLYKIVDTVHASRGAVTYQLRILVSNGTVKIYEKNGFRRYYLSNFDYTKGDALLNIYLENEIKASIIHALQEESGQSRQELAEKISIPENTLYRHITALFKAGILKRVRDGHKWRYSVAEKMRKE